jgi:CSLREA domain-containing protein
MRKYVLAIIGLVLLCLVAALGTASGSASTFTVNTTDDTDDLTCDTSHCSLREAINAANSAPGSTIEFNIPLTDTGYQVSGISGTWTISLTSSLPPLTGGGTIISGTTQADLNPDGPEIEISGADMGSGACLWIESANNVIHGLVINRCPLHGVVLILSSATTNTVSGNYIGTDASGSTELGNGTTGVLISDGAQGNVVGGDTPEERNVISGNDPYGVYVTLEADWNTVSGNYIGTDATGATKLGNAGTGVAIAYGSQNNTVGGDTEGERNIISGNGSDGVSISESGTDNNTISGNFIGTVVSGTQALGNTGDGVRISAGARNNTVGGATEGERNVIAANRMGVNIVGSDTMSNTVSGNYIGTDVTGTLDRGNTYAGVQIASGAQNNTVGGQTAGERNVISANNFYGVHIDGTGADDNTVSGNYIGTDAGGSQELGNTYNGIMIAGGAQNNTIGGQTAAERNVIAASTWSGVGIKGAGTNGNTVSQNYIGTDVTGTLDKGNSWDGVRIDDGAQDNTVGPGNLIFRNERDGVRIDGSLTISNTIPENSIYDNDWQGIVLANSANGGILAPSIGPANCISITGTAPANSTVEVFTGPDDEGKTYLATSAADGTGDWSVTGPFSLDAYVTATATDAAGNTSEFSAEADGVCYRGFLPLTVKNY